MPGIKRGKNLYQLVMDFLKKCNDDHVGAFGAMSAFFILLSLFPFMIFLLTLTKYIPFSKDDLIFILTKTISFEESSLITSLVNEIYSKTATTVSAISIIAALWSASRGIYSIVIGLNSVYDIDENRNYFVIRFFSLGYTLLFTVMISIMLVLWVFGNSLYRHVRLKLPLLSSVMDDFMNKRILFSLVFLTLLFMIIYKWIPNRKSSFVRQLPGALIATIGWLVVSAGCSVYVDHFGNFSYIYGSVAGIMILILWLYFCMSMVFYGAEVNYFLENKRNYHMLIRILRPNVKRMRREKEKELRAGIRKKSQNRNGKAGPQKEKEDTGMYPLSEQQIRDITEYIFLEDAPQKADVIFIPGCNRPEHTQEAAKLYHQGYAPLLVPSGGYSKNEGSFQGVSPEGRTYGEEFTCEADFLAQVLLQNGVPESAVLKEREATYTLENAEKTRSLLEAKGIAVKKAILCCKAHHARRAFLYYAMVFPQVEILVHPTAIDGITRETWYQSETGRRAVLGELSRIGQQLLMMEGRIQW